MLTRIGVRLRRFRRIFSRSRWLTHMLGLSVSRGPGTRKGLVMLQIDGLSQQQFRKALNEGRLPFLKKLIRREQYQEHRLYSGLPSSTPAVQAEIFYGIKTSVPAFSFFDRDKDEMVRMYYPDTARKVEEVLAGKCDDALMEGGSSYSNNYTGGAKMEEAHFCASSLNLKQALRAGNPLTLGVLILSNLSSVLRILLLLVAEFALSLLDFVRGLSDGRDFIKELKFVPTRVGICILLRELCVIGGKMDIHRGLPIVHINFIGYDEQSHRRGPDAKFSHWALKGIDYSIKRLWREAARSERRNYEVWVYSDHGQCFATPYSQEHDNTIEEAVDAVIKELSGQEETGQELAAGELINVMGMDATLTQCLCSVFGNSKHPEHQTENGKTRVAGLGPVGLIYFAETFSSEQLARAAKILCHSHGIPAVVYGRENEQLWACTKAGEFKIPQQMEKVFGEDHPFIEMLGEDLEALCRHPDGGDITMLGWCKGEKSLTFVTENGSHAGLTHEETNAFMLLPQDAPLAQSKFGYYRPTDLRNAALSYLGRRSAPPRIRRSRQQEGKPLRIMTYNVHSCIGMDGKLDVERVARVIGRSNPDVVALQELDVRRFRTEGIDQAALIADYLEMDYHFHPSIHIEEEQYGDAILTHLPLKLIKSGSLPGTRSDSKQEPRGALWVSIDVYGREVHIINTHLGLSSRERKLQIETLLGEEWLTNSRCDKPVILCGDFNTIPISKIYRKLSRHLKDVQANNGKTQKTFSSRLPLTRIDHIFVDESFSIDNVTAPSTYLSQVASDHLPLVADITVGKDADIILPAGSAQSKLTV